MKRLILFILFLSTNVYAYYESYKIGDTVILFENRDGVMVNASCFIKPCVALNQEKLNKFKELENGQLTGGKNPAAVRCKMLLKGIVVFGTTSEGDQQSFCYFSEDQSYIKN